MAAVLCGAILSGVFSAMAAVTGMRLRERRHAEEHLHLQQAEEEEAERRKKIASMRRAAGSALGGSGSSGKGRDGVQLRPLLRAGDEEDAPASAHLAGGSVGGGPLEDHSGRGAYITGSGGGSAHAVTGRAASSQFPSSTSVSAVLAGGGVGGRVGGRVGSSGGVVGGGDNNGGDWRRL